MSKAYRRWKEQIKACNRDYGDHVPTTFSYYRFCIHFNQALFGKHFDKSRMVTPRE